MRGSPLPPPCIGLRASDHPLKRKLQTQHQPAPSSPPCASLLPSSLQTATSSAGSTDTRGNCSSSITYSWIHLILRCRSLPPPCPLHCSRPEGRGWNSGGEGGLRRIRFSSRDWIIRAGKTGAVLYAGCRSRVCGRTVADPSIIANKNTTPPVCVPPPLAGRSSKKQTS